MGITEYMTLQITCSSTAKYLTIQDAYLPLSLSHLYCLRIVIPERIWAITNAERDHETLPYQHTISEECLRGIMSDTLGWKQEIAQIAYGGTKMRTAHGTRGRRRTVHGTRERTERQSPSVLMEFCTTDDILKINTYNRNTPYIPTYEINHRYLQ